VLARNKLTLVRENIKEIFSKEGSPLRKGNQDGKAPGKLVEVLSSMGG
jgi:hypothetical protein